MKWQRKKITGEEEVFTDLYDFRANIEGARSSPLLKPLIEKKMPNWLKLLKQNLRMLMLYWTNI